jgi:hypothetical protein
VAHDALASPVTLGEIPIARVPQDLIVDIPIFNFPMD